jgi:PRTRC genetic system protein B
MEKIDVSARDKRYVLGAAVLLYSNASKGYQSHENTAIATVHHVHDVDGKPVIAAGRPMTEADYLAMVHVLAPKEKPQIQWHDASILASGMGKMVWWTPPMHRPMFFTKSTMFGESTFDGRAVCPLPGMVWLTDESTLSVFAVRGHQRPQQDTRLCQAPLFNVWARGEVCSGNALKPEEAQAHDPKAWERYLFESNFSHPNFAQVDRLTKGVNPCEFWRDMVTSPRESFPEEVLVDLNLTVSDLLEPDFDDRAPGLRATGEF